LGKYDPLHRHLLRQQTASYEMSFRDVERIIGALLPRGAQRPEWWANEQAPDPRHVQCRAWLAAGFHAFLVKGAERIRFERRQAAPAG